MTTGTVLVGRERRRRWTTSEKLRLVEESFAPGASVAEVARRHEVHPNQLHGWRKEARSGSLSITPGPQACFAAVEIADQVALPAPAVIPEAPPSTRSDLRLLQYDDFARYCVKMATGSGKTKVMSLTIAWQFFNAVAEARDDFAKTFLLIAPNVIVFERLRIDFEGSAIFNSDPIIPDALRIYWDFQCYMRDESERASSLGALYLANVQQFYERQEGK